MLILSRTLREKEGMGGRGGGGGGQKAVGRNGRSCMGVQNRSQMTSHCNGNHSKTSVSLSV